MNSPETINLEGKKMISTMRALSLAGIACLATATMIGSGVASDEFSITNDLEDKFHADVYDAKDGLCATARKSDHIDSGDTKKIHCEGQGTGHCQVRFWYSENGDKHHPCPGSGECGDTTNVKNNADVVITYDNGNVVCQNLN